MATRITPDQAALCSSMPRAIDHPLRRMVRFKGNFVPVRYGWSTAARSRGYEALWVEPAQARTITLHLAE